VNSNHGAEYRFNLATTYLNQARRRLRDEEWHSCVGESQLAVENAAKCVMACFLPVPRSHDMENLLKSLLCNLPDLEEEIVEYITRLIDIAGKHGLEEHIAVTYGDEETQRLPAELFNEESAQNALSDAEEAIAIARAVFQWRFPEENNKEKL